MSQNNQERLEKIINVESNQRKMRGKKMTRHKHLFMPHTCFGTLTYQCKCGVYRNFSHPHRYIDYIITNAGDRVMQCWRRLDKIMDEINISSPMISDNSTIKAKEIKD